MYHVFFGNLTIYGTETVNGTSDRDITVYNGIGQGNFPIADDKNLRSWTLSAQFTAHNDHGLDGWEPAKDLFAGFEKMLVSKNPERLVIASTNWKLSELVLLESYSYEETHPGAYDVTIKVTEYKKAQKRTTGIPVITRPGKIPDPPKTMVFKNATQVAGAAVKSSRKLSAEEMAANVTRYTFTDQSGVLQHTNNPNLVALNTPVQIDSITGFSDDIAGGPSLTGGKKWNPADTFNAMGKAISEYWDKHTAKGPYEGGARYD